MKRFYIIVIILFVLLTISAGEGSGTLPDSLERPQKGESPRYPQDFIIGELGKGDASEEVYNYAKKMLTGFLNQRQDTEGITGDLWGRTNTPVNAIFPEKFRLGGGREEMDGSTSFIFRFIGREQWIAGEIYIRFQDAVPIVRQESEKSEETPEIKENSEPVDNNAPEEEPVTETEYTKAGWRVDDIILDDPKKTGEGGAAYQYDFSPYERFF